MRAGIGGWTYDAWRETFYPPGIKQKSELEYASRQVTVIEINGTYYRTQKPASFAKWRDATPDDFVKTIDFCVIETHWQTQQMHAAVCTTSSQSMVINDWQLGD